MFDDFFTRAMVAGIGVALVAGPLGCFVVWKRMSYFGDTLAHAALLGVAMALLININILLAVFLLSVAVAVSMLILQSKTPLPSDALLGLLSHSAMAMGLVAISFITWTNIDLSGLLFGDILAVSRFDLIIIYLGILAILTVLFYIWKPLFVTSVNPELAQAEGVQTDKVNLVFMLLMASVIAISMKIVGVLLITALLIIPAASARSISGSPESMALIATVIGVLSVVFGLNASFYWDTPSGPSIVVAAFGFFLLSLSPLKLLINKASGN